MRIIVNGGRSFQSYLTLCEVLDRIIIDELVSFGDVGTGALVEAYAKANSIKYTELERDGDSIVHFNADLVVSFPGNRTTCMTADICCDICLPILFYNDKGQLTGM